MKSYRPADLATARNHRSIEDSVAAEEANSRAELPAERRRQGTIAATVLPKVSRKYDVTRR